MTIVCVDDHSIMLKGMIKNIQRILPDASVHAFLGADEALAFIKENRCDVLISEIELCGSDGIAFVDEIQKIHPKVNIIFHTVCDEKEHAREVLKLKPSAYLVKPAKKEQFEIELMNLRYQVS